MVSRSSAPASLLEEILAGGQGWLWTACILGLAALPPLALSQSGWLGGIRTLALLTMLAAALGLILAQRRRRPGVVVAVVVVGLTLGFLLSAGPVGLPGQMLEQARQGVRRFGWWATVVWLGGSNDDPLVPTVFAAWSLWLACLWLGWSQGSNRSTLAGALPLGVVLAANAFFTVGGWVHLVAFVALTMLLLAISQVRRLHAGCERRGAICDPGATSASVALALPLAAGALLLALVLPPFTSEQLADAFWARAERPWRTTVRLVKWLFPGLSPWAATSPWLDDAGGAAMPSARDLVHAVAPEETVVMYVETSDPPPIPEPDSLRGIGLADRGPKRYWRGMTYDVYTGRGWANARTDAVTLAAGSRLSSAPAPGMEVAQSFQIVAPRDELLYALEEPAYFQDDVRAHWRGEGDLAYLKAPLGQYEVVSRSVDPTEAQLRAAGRGYPLWVRERYLVLPDVPSRVEALALTLTANQTNPYDQLLAIEQHLRANYQYDLAVGEPAPGKDVVDFFLFESRSGFCDHYASALVVLARAAGIPARLASGYTSGIYDYDQHRYVVRAGNAHSWPEAYFPSIGWVAFEPTVTQATFYHPAGADSAVAAPAPPTSVSGARRSSGLLSVLTITAAVAGLTTWWIWRRRIPQDPVLRAYWTMEMTGARLGVGAAGMTPREYGAMLAARVRELAPSWLDDRLAGGSILSDMALAYEAKRYRRTGESEGLSWAGWRRAETSLWVLTAGQLPRTCLTGIRRMWSRRVRA